MRTFLRHSHRDMYTQECSGSCCSYVHTQCSAKSQDLRERSYSVSPRSATHRGTKTQLTEGHWRHSGFYTRRANIGGQWSGWSIDHDFSQVIQQLLRSVLSGLKLEESRVFVNEVGVNHASQELGMCQHIVQERSIGLETGEEEYEDS